MVTATYAGIYDPPHAARYLLAGRMAHEVYPVDSRTIIRWAHKGLADPDLSGVRGWDMILTFEDLVSLRVIAALRAAKIGWKAIRQAERWLREATKHPRPFAREEVWSSTSDVFVKFRGMMIAASRHGQIAMDIIVNYLIPVSGLSFENKVARAWEPRALITLDPKVQFGEPCIKGTRIPAASVATLVASGDPRSVVMDAYGLNNLELEAALEWTASVTGAR